MHGNDDDFIVIAVHRKTEVLVSILARILPKTSFLHVSDSHSGNHEEKSHIFNNWDCHIGSGFVHQFYSRHFFPTM